MDSWHDDAGRFLGARPGPFSEIRLIRRWYRIEALVENVIVVHLAHLFLVRDDYPVARPSRPPRLVEGAGVVDREGHIERVAPIRDLEALHHV
jgi:hypothetical protein